MKRAKGSFHRAWRGLLGNQQVMLMLRIALGSIFIVSGSAKLLNAGEFIGVVGGYGLLPQGLAELYGSTLPFIELFLGCLLVLGILTRLISVIAIFLVASFVTANIYIMTFGNVSSGALCGCFGEMAPLSHTGSLVLGGFMSLMALPLALGESRLLTIRYSTRKYAGPGLLSGILIATLVLSPVSLSGASTDTTKTVEAVPDAILSESPLDSAIGTAVESGKQALLYFYSEECPYCQKQGPIVDELETEYGKSVAFVRVNLESDVQMTKEFGVTAVPTMVLSYGKDSWGEHEYQRFEGFTDRDTLERYLDDVGYLWTDGVASSENEAAAPPPPDEDCDSYDDHGEKIKCKTGKLLDEVCNGTVPLISQARHLVSANAEWQADDVDEMETECAFATAMFDETDPAEFKGFALKRNADKKGFAEYEPLGDGDGICNKGGGKPDDIPGEGDSIPGYSEWCAEELYDGIGDDDGICEILHEPGEKKIREACVQISDAQAIDENDENFKENKFIAYETYLDDTLGDIEEANQALEVMVAHLEELEVQAEMLSNGGPEVCENMLETGPEIYNEHVVPWYALWLTLGGYLIGQAAYDVCTPIGQQDVAGFNSSTGCIVAVVVKNVAQFAWETMELLEDTITGMHAQNTAKCLEYHHAQQTAGFNAVNAGIGDQALALEEVKGRLDNTVELRRVHLQVIELEPKRKLLVSASEAGKPIADVELVALGVSERDPIDFHDMTGDTEWQSVDTGVYVLKIDLPPSMKNVELYKLEVKHLPDPDEEHFGFVLFDRSTQNTICTGQ